MIRKCMAGLVAATGVAAMVSPPLARADDAVTYRVESDIVSMMNVEYVDQTGRRLLEGVPLPWRLDVDLDDAKGPLGHGARCGPIGGQRPGQDGGSRSRSKATESCSAKALSTSATPRATATHPTFPNCAPSHPTKGPQ